MAENEREDRRSRLSRRMLREALIELMKTRSLHEISVKKICETADVNRSTFYRYYDSQYELYAEIMEDVTREIYRRVEKTPAGPNRLREILTDVFSYFEQERALILVLLSANGNLSLGETFSGLVQKLTDSDGTSELALYCSQFLSAGLTSIVWLWLSKEERRAPQEVAAVLSTLFLHGVKRAMLFSGNGDLF